VEPAPPTVRTSHSSSFVPSRPSAPTPMPRSTLSCTPSVTTVWTPHRTCSWRPLARRSDQRHLLQHHPQGRLSPEQVLGHPRGARRNACSRCAPHWVDLRHAQAEADARWSELTRHIGRWSRCSSRMAPRTEHDHLSRPPRRVLPSARLRPRSAGFQRDAGDPLAPTFRWLVRGLHEDSKAEEACFVLEQMG